MSKLFVYCGYGLIVEDNEPKPAIAVGSVLNTAKTTSRIVNLADMQ
jgi:hypothetical protein